MGVCQLYRRGGGGFGGENEWAETVAQNLAKILERMDEREGAYASLRDDIRDYLDGFELDADGNRRRLDDDEPVNYGLLLKIIEGFYPAIPTDYWMLVDMVAYKIIRIRGILNQIGDKLPFNRRVRILSKLREWISLAVYEVGKITIQEIERRESEIRKSAIGILSMEAAPLLSRGPVGAETRRYIRKEAESRGAGIDDDDDDEEDDGQVF